MRKKIIYILLFLFFLGDTAYSFMQHYAKPLDGDMAESIVPAEKVKPLLGSPFGAEAILKGNTYINPNRFFSHWSIYQYFNHVPFWLQKNVNPIDSIYLSCAIIKTLLQLILIFLLAASIVGSINIFKTDFMIATVLIFPLIQTNGYNRYMGIIDASATYTFFYALPLALLVLFLFPIIFQYFHHRNAFDKLFYKIAWVIPAVLVCFSGALNPGIILIVLE